MSYDEAVRGTADQAFHSPTVLASKRLRRNSPRSMASVASSVSDAHSATSRRSASVITSPEQAELFDTMISSTSVTLSPSGTNKKNLIFPPKLNSPVSPPPPTSPLASPKMIRSPRADNGSVASARGSVNRENRWQSEGKSVSDATGSLTSPSPLRISGSHQRGLSVPRLQSPAKDQISLFSATPTDTGESDREDSSESVSSAKQRQLDAKSSSDRMCDSSDRPVPTTATVGVGNAADSSIATRKSTLDLQNNDNSFHVLANLLVDFFKAKKVPSLNRYVLFPEDRARVERLLPASARRDFINAVRERLECTPDEPTTPLQFLTLECKRLGFDREDASNPILATVDMTTEPVTVEIGLDSKHTSYDEVSETRRKLGLNKLAEAGRVIDLDDVSQARRDLDSDDVSDAGRISGRGPNNRPDTRGMLTLADTSQTEDVVSESCRDTGSTTRNETATSGSYSEIVADAEVDELERKYSCLLDDMKENRSQSGMIPDAVEERLRNSEAKEIEFASSWNEMLVPIPSTPKEQGVPPASRSSPHDELNICRAENAQQERGFRSEPASRSYEENSPHDELNARLGENAKLEKGFRSEQGSGSVSPVSPRISVNGVPIVQPDYSLATENGVRPEQPSRSLVYFDRSPVSEVLSPASESRASIILNPRARASPVSISSQECSPRRTVPGGQEETRSNVISPRRTLPISEEDPGMHPKPVCRENPGLPQGFSNSAPPQPVWRENPGLPQGFTNSAPNALERKPAPMPPVSNDTVLACGEDQNYQKQDSLDAFSLPTQNQILKARLEEQKKQLADQQAVVSGLLHQGMLASDSTVGTEIQSLNDGDASVSTEGMVRQQLLAELREASNLMAQSVTPETSKFWRDHVVELQARLRALHGDDTSVTSYSQQSQTPEDILENNRRLMTEFQQREQYVPPIVESADSRTNSSAVQPRPTSKNDVVPAQYEAPMVDVVAPADLPGGYRFEAEIEGQRFLAVVPPGGVQQGETFTCLMRELDSVAIDIPVGYWKDSMSNVFGNGFFHTALWNGLFCPLISLSQIQTRVHLDFLGRPRDFELSGLSNRSMMVLVIAFWFLVNVALFAGYNFKWMQGLELSIADMIALGLINVSMFAFTVFVAQSTRSSLREKFMIREQRCYDLEDLCCATWCLPCTVCQMSRHTANYDDYDAVCCSQTGLPDGVRVNQERLRDESTGFVV